MPFAGAPPQVTPARGVACVRLPAGSGAAVVAFPAHTPPARGADGAAQAGAGPGSQLAAAEGDEGGGRGVRLLVAAAAGVLYEYELDGWASEAGPRAVLRGEWSLLDSG